MFSKSQTITPFIKSILLERFPDLADWNCSFPIWKVNAILSSDGRSRHFYVSFDDNNNQALYEK